jgi:Protein of unknown function (DUF2934)
MTATGVPATTQSCCTPARLIHSGRALLHENYITGKWQLQRMDYVARSNAALTPADMIKREHIRKLLKFQTPTILLWHTIGSQEDPKWTIFMTEKLAYRLWQERGSPIGSPDVDWFRAEKEMKQATRAWDLSETNG